MYVNMTPDKTNKTLHASQDDTKRQFKFKLVNDSQVLDTSDSIPPVIYDVEPNGVEQLLPVNSSTPTTSPIIADIQYPDELREDQEFFERITPTTIKGKAKIEKIKGNTLVFNQLKGTPTGLTTQDGTTFTLLSDGGIGVTGTAENNHFANYRTTENPEFMLKTGHKYYYSYKGWRTGVNFQLSVSASGLATKYLINEKTQDIKGILEYTDTGYTSTNFRFFVDNTYDGTTTIYMYLIDLTLMFGSGNEPTSVSDFTDLFPLPYYDYNAGSLVSFNGTGLKTIGKNLFNPDLTDVPLSNCTGTQVNGVISLTASGSDMYANRQAIKGSNWSSSTGKLISVLPNTQYTLKLSNSSFNKQFISFFNSNLVATRDYVSTTSNTYTFTTGNNEYYIVLRFGVGNAVSGTTYSTTIQLEIGNTATTYEPYKETTTSLPTSTYFPTGMKSAGSIYDEVNIEKKITRVGSKLVSELNWGYNSTYNFIYTSSLTDCVSFNTTNYMNILSDGYVVDTYVSSVSQMENATDKTIRARTGTAVPQIYIKDTAYSNASDFVREKGNMVIYYQLATPTEEDIESCSLVSEDVEIPLEYDNGFLVCDSEGLTTKSGFIPCKVKKAKGDETLYSQLINLHVERKP